jgi:hypothetical protein
MFSKELELFNGQENQQMYIKLGLKNGKMQFESLKEAYPIYQG